MTNVFNAQHIHGTQYKHKENTQKVSINQFGSINHGKLVILLMWFGILQHRESFFPLRLFGIDSGEILQQSNISTTIVNVMNK